MILINCCVAVCQVRDTYSLYILNKYFKLMSYFVYIKYNYIVIFFYSWTWRKLSHVSCRIYDTIMSNVIGHTPCHVPYVPSHVTRVCIDFLKSPCCCIEWVNGPHTGYPYIEGMSACNLY